MKIADTTGFGDSVSTDRSIVSLLRPLFDLASSSKLQADCLGCWRAGGELFFLPRFLFRSSAEIREQKKIAIVAGLQGHDLAGVGGVTSLVRALCANQFLARDFELWLYPLCNPSGYIDQSPRSRAGATLEDGFWSNSSAPEVILLEKDLQGQQFAGLITLGSHDLGDHVRGSGNGTVLGRPILRSALMAAERALPPNESNSERPLPTSEATIATLSEAVPGPPAQFPRPFEICLEAPRRISLRCQQQALLLGIHAIISGYRNLLASQQTSCLAA